MNFGDFFGGFGGGGHHHFQGHDSSDSDSNMHDESEEKNELYKILGVAPDAEASTFRKAYLKACQKGEYKHPDKGGDPEKFKKLQLALEVLSDEEKRKIYDKAGMAGIRKYEKSAKHQMQKRQQQRKVEDSVKEFEISLEEAFKGGEKTFSFKRQRCCSDCLGKGGSKVTTCGTCDGQGRVAQRINFGGMMMQQVAACPKCEGKGKQIADLCKKCNGKKVKIEIKDFEVHIPPGCYDGHKQVKAQEGNEVPDAQAGDLIIVTKIREHKQFQRKGADLFLEKHISLVEALTGATFDIPYLDGSKFQVTTMPGDIIAPLTKRTVRDKGMPLYKDEFHHGNLHITFKIDFPKDGSIKNSDMEVLKKILKAQPQSQLPKNDKEFEYLEDFHEDELNNNPEGGRIPDDEYDEDEMGGGQRVQCNAQ